MIVTKRFLKKIFKQELQIRKNIFSHKPRPPITETENRKNIRKEIVPRSHPQNQNSQFHR